MPTGLQIARGNCENGSLAFWLMSLTRFGRDRPPSRRCRSRRGVIGSSPRDHCCTPAPPSAGLSWTASVDEEPLLFMIADEGTFRPQLRGNCRVPRLEHCLITVENVIEGQRLPGGEHWCRCECLLVPAQSWPTVAAEHPSDWLVSLRRPPYPVSIPATHRDSRYVCIWFRIC